MAAGVGALPLSCPRSNGIPPGAPISADLYFSARTSFAVCIPSASAALGFAAASPRQSSISSAVPPSFPILAASSSSGVTVVLVSRSSHRPQPLHRSRRHSATVFLFLLVHSSGHFLPVSFSLRASTSPSASASQRTASAGFPLLQQAPSLHRRPIFFSHLHCQDRLSSTRPARWRPRSNSAVRSWPRQPLAIMGICVHVATRQPRVKLHQWLANYNWQAGGSSSQVFRTRNERRV